MPKLQLDAIGSFFVGILYSVCNLSLQNFTFSVIIIRNREFAKPNPHEAAKFTRLTADTAFLTLNIR